MSRPLFARSLAVLLLLGSGLTACAPPAGMSATLTMLPGFLTAPPPTRRPTSPPDLSATRTVPPLSTGDVTDTPAPDRPTARETTPAPTFTSTVDAATAACPPFSLDANLPSSANPAGFIGKHYDTQSLPAGLALVGTGLLSSPTSSYAHLRWRSRDLFWIQTLACQNRSGKGYRQITDALALPVLDAQAHQVYTDVCFNGAAPLPFAIAYGVYNPSQPATTVMGSFSGWRMQVTAAWQMKEKFTPLNPQSVTCIVQQP